MAREDFYDSLFGRTYSAYMDRPQLGRAIARAVWGSDSGQYYRSMSAIAEVPVGGTIVDCPCGAGPALRLGLEVLRVEAAERGLELGLEVGVPLPLERDLYDEPPLPDELPFPPLPLPPLPVMTSPLPRPARCRRCDNPPAPPARLRLCSAPMPALP